MNTIINLNYRGNSVPVKMVGGEPWVNLNAIGRPFSKEPNQWLKGSSAQDYIDAVELLNGQADCDPLALKNSHTSITVQHGGKNPGTWASEMVALEFARWCDPAFAVWCNRQLRELITKGTAQVNMQEESLKLKWDQTLVMVKQGKKWGSRFQDFLKECERPVENKDPRARYSDLISKFFGAFGSQSYEFKKELIHKMRLNFQTYKDEFLMRSKNKALDMALIMDVDRELENMWARFEAHARAQTMRRVRENKVEIIIDNSLDKPKLIM